mgnify:CR=1 FL=1
MWISKGIRQPEVDYLQILPFFIKKQVFGLQVPVRDLLTVQILDTINDLKVEFGGLGLV